MSWLIDPRVGLLSCVTADDPTTGRPSTTLVMVRARSRQHLLNLKRLCTILADAEISEARSDLDYPVRLVVARDVFVQVMAELARTLSHRNVKAAAHANEKALGADFVRAMHVVHAALAKIGDEPHSERTK